VFLLVLVVRDAGYKMSGYKMTLSAVFLLLTELAAVAANCDCGWTGRSVWPSSASQSSASPPPPNQVGTFGDPCHNNDGSCCWAVCCRSDFSCLSGGSSGGGGSAGGGGSNGGVSTSPGGIGNPSFGLSPGSLMGGECDAGSSPLLLFWSMLIGGLLVFFVMLLSACGCANACVPSAPSAWILRLLRAVAIASLVVVLSCAYSGLFDLMDVSCMAAAATAMSLVPFIASSTLLLLVCCAKFAFDAPLWGFTAGGIVSCFLLLWWTATTGLLTFFGPFTVTSNAYFACWVGLLFMIFAITWRRSADAAGAEAAPGFTQSEAGLLSASLVVLLACLSRLQNSGEAAFLFAGSIVTAIVIAMLRYQPCSWIATWRIVLRILLVLLWITIVWFATFVGPFQMTGNGYFAAHLGLACSLASLMQEARAEHAEDVRASIAEGRAPLAVAAIAAAAPRNLLTVLGCSSLVVVLQSSGGREGLALYALCVGGVSLCVVLLTLIHRAVAKTRAATLEQSIACIWGGTPFSFEALLALFLTVWWAVGAGILTFMGPFTVTSNSYFACWVALLGSAAMLTSLVSPINQMASEAKAAARGRRRGLVGILLAAVVLLAASISTGTSYWQCIYSVVCAALTIVDVVILSVATEAGGPFIRSIIIVVLLCLWLCEIFVATFSGPFSITNNGYFSAWLGFASACHIASNDIEALNMLPCCLPCVRAANPTPKEEPQHAAAGKERGEGGSSSSSSSSSSAAAASSGATSATRDGGSMTEMSAISETSAVADRPSQFSEVSTVDVRILNEGGAEAHQQAKPPPPSSAPSRGESVASTPGAQGEGRCAIQ
jgi:hypothetical protein